MHFVEYKCYEVGRVEASRSRSLNTEVLETPGRAGLRHCGNGDEPDLDCSGRRSREAGSVRPTSVSTEAMQRLTCRSNPPPTMPASKARLEHIPSASLARIADGRRTRLV